LQSGHLVSTGRRACKSERRGDACKQHGGDNQRNRRTRTTPLGRIRRDDQALPSLSDEAPSNRSHSARNLTLRTKALQARRVPAAVQAFLSRLATLQRRYDSSTRIVTMDVLTATLTP